MKILSAIIAALLLMSVTILSACTDGSDDASTSAATDVAETTATETSADITTELDYESALNDFFENGYTGEPIELPDIPLS